MVQRAESKKPSSKDASWFARSILVNAVLTRHRDYSSSFVKKERYNEGRITERCSGGRYEERRERLDERIGLSSPVGNMANIFVAIDFLIETITSRTLRKIR
jgi:hypothetical protein